MFQTRSIQPPASRFARGHLRPDISRSMHLLPSARRSRPSRPSIHSIVAAFSQRIHSLDMVYDAASAVRNNFQQPPGARRATPRIERRANGSSRRGRAVPGYSDGRDLSQSGRPRASLARSSRCLRPFVVSGWPGPRWADSGSSPCRRPDKPSGSPFCSPWLARKRCCPRRSAGYGHTTETRTTVPGP
jgi:hypothetical protein